MLVKKFFIAHWGTTSMIISSGMYEVEDLEGFVFMQNQQIIGLITYVEKDRDVEIISLDSQDERQGIGSSLYRSVENFAKEVNKNIVLFTTNDNLPAMRFWQKKKISYA